MKTKYVWKQLLLSNCLLNSLHSLAVFSELASIDTLRKLIERISSEAIIPKSQVTDDITASLMDQALARTRLLKEFKTKGHTLVAPLVESCFELKYHAPVKAHIVAVATSLRSSPFNDQILCVRKQIIPLFSLLKELVGREVTFRLQLTSKNLVPYIASVSIWFLIGF